MTWLNSDLISGQFNRRGFRLLDPFMVRKGWMDRIGFSFRQLIPVTVRKMRGVFCIGLALAALALMQGDEAISTPQQAIAQQQNGDWSGAEKTWRALTKSSPGDYRYWTSLGACLAHEEHFDDAIG